VVAAAQVGTRARRPLRAKSARAAGAQPALAQPALAQCVPRRIAGFARELWLGWENHLIIANVANGTNVASKLRMLRNPAWIAVICLGLFACSGTSGEANEQSDDASGGQANQSSQGQGGSDSSEDQTADCDCALGAYRPACGTDGNTYDATCGLTCLPVPVACEGECPCSEDAGFIDCPDVAPSGGEPCSLDEPPVCEYGDFQTRWCNLQASCKYFQAEGPESATWMVTQPREACEPSTNNPVECPEDYASVPEGECDSDGLTCAYAQGTCGCRMQFRGQAYRTPQWFCEPLQDHCPWPRALLGAPCDEESLICDYGLCLADGRAAMVCAKGYWMEAAVQCEEPPFNP